MKLNLKKIVGRDEETMRIKELERAKRGILINIAAKKSAIEAIDVELEAIRNKNKEGK